MTFTGCIYSKSMDTDTWISIVMPDRIPNRSRKPHRVIYALHGSAGNCMHWVHNTRLPLYANEYNVSFILPEIGNTWYRDIKDRGDYFTYIIDELPEKLGGMFNISPRREDTAIIGNSMGAYGALKCALIRPGQYWLCGAFSTASAFLGDYLEHLRAHPMENPPMRSVYGPGFEWHEEDELLLLARKTAQNPVKPILYLTVGKQDIFHPSNERFIGELKTLPFEYRYETWDGGHDWYFWDESLKKILELHYK